MNYYEILGVTKHSTQDEIKKAYRKLASKNHPDKGGDTEKFKDIQVAFDTLSNQDKRNRYDYESLHEHKEFVFRTSSWKGAGGGNDDPFTDMIDALRRQFAGGGGAESFYSFHDMHQNKKSVNHDIKINLQIPLANTLEEHKKTILVKIPGGTSETVEVTIPRGVQNGSTIRYNGLGMHKIEDVPRGDLYIHFIVTPHENFHQVGTDLLTAITITSIEAITGCDREVTGLDGKTFKISIPSGSQFGAKFGLPEQGLYKSDRTTRGRLIVSLEIVTPTGLTKDQIDILLSLKV